MYRFTLFFIALFASVLVSLASPVPVANGELVNLEKRITHKGRGTWFTPGLGNCGWYNSESDLIVAISKTLYDQNGGSNCNQFVEITNVANGKKVTAKTVDSCPGCGYNDLDLSPAAFQKLGSLDLGVLSISWNFKKRT